MATPLDGRPRPLSPKDVADVLQMHVGTVRAKLERGEIPGVKIGRRWYVRPEDLDALLAGER